MRTRNVIIAVASLALTGSSSTDWIPATVTLPDGTQLRVETVVDGLDTVWDMGWAPDGSMWITERGGRVSRVDVSTGAVTPVGTVPEVRERGEGGLMGFAFHPQFPQQPWVYFAHTYDSGGGGRGGAANRLMRMRFESGQLGQAQTLIDGIRGAGNHNGSRIAFGPDGFLYMTMGEAGNRSLSQETSSLNGKVLRVTAEGQPAPGNPFGNAVWSYGHRNPQGIDFQPGTGVPYVSEHGQSREDEVSRIERGGNYGWPMVEGMCDESDEQEHCASTIEPVEVFMPTVGIAGMAFYNGDLIPGWKGNILTVALRGESLYRIMLTPDGRRSANTERLFQGQFGRIRTVLPGPDGVVYLGTSNSDGRGRPARADRILRIRP